MLQDNVFSPVHGFVYERHVTRCCSSSPNLYGRFYEFNRTPQVYDTLSYSQRKRNISPNFVKLRASQNYGLMLEEAT